MGEDGSEGLRLNAEERLRLLLIRRKSSIKK